MVVDDDHDFVQLIRRMLSAISPKFQLSYAHSGGEALALLSTNQPDLILLDLQLPDMAGADVIRELKQRADCAHVPGTGHLSGRYQRRNVV